MTKVAVVGNVSRDVVDGGEPTPGGCPTFAAEAFHRVGRKGQIVTRYAEPDAALFEQALDAATVLPAAATCGFEIEYDGEERSMRVTAFGESWRPEDAVVLAPDVEWVHVAPLLRGDFPPATLDALAAVRRLSLDGQGLVRVPALGELREDVSFEPALLEHVTALKLSEHEAEIVAGGRFDLNVAAWLGVPEVLLTLGSRGAVVLAEGRETLVDTAPVLDVHTTGAGDVFMVAYAVFRVDGQGPVDAARAACRVVGELLEARREKQSVPG